MTNNSIFLKNGDMQDIVEIKGNSLFQNYLTANKLELNSNEIENENIQSSVNKSSKMMFSLSKETIDHFFPLTFFSQAKFTDFRNIIFKCPLTFLVKMNEEIMEKETRIKAFLLIGIIQKNFKFPYLDCIFRIELNKKLENCFLSEKFKRNLKVFIKF
jgi:hypothetical protein